MTKDEFVERYRSVLLGEMAYSEYIRQSTDPLAKSNWHIRATNQAERFLRQWYDLLKAEPAKPESAKTGTTGTATIPITKGR